MIFKKAPVLIAYLCACFILSCSYSNNDNELADDLHLYIPDANFEAKLISLGIDSDNEVNRQLLRTDAASVKTLDLDKNNIADLTGIEGFLSLTKLSASLNDIPSIDLSANTQLDTLYLIGNQLKTVDLSQNTKLLYVNVDSNQLKTLTGISEATKLKWLNASFNYLKAFSIHSEAIETLYISDNDLESFDVDGALNLKNIFIKTNKLTSIDLSTNPLLETLVLSDNQIQEINLEHTPDLTVVYISSNVLTSLDVSNLEALSFLSVYNNPDLSCIKISDGQDVPNLTASDYQVLNPICD